MVIWYHYLLYTAPLDYPTLSFTNIVFPCLSKNIYMKKIYICIFYTHVHPVF